MSCCFILAGKKDVFHWFNYNVPKHSECGNAGHESSNFPILQFNVSIQLWLSCRGEEKSYSHSRDSLLLALTSVLIHLKFKSKEDIWILFLYVIGSFSPCQWGNNSLWVVENKQHPFTNRAMKGWSQRDWAGAREQPWWSPAAAKNMSAT